MNPEIDITINGKTAFLLYQNAHPEINIGSVENNIIDQIVFAVLKNLKNNNLLNAPVSVTSNGNTVTY